MSEIGPADLSVVIPTRNRWDILRRNLAALEAQSVQGFETIVVVDGTDQEPPDLGAARTLVKEHGGPGAARNHGARASDRQLILLLGDDMFPTPQTIELHLAAHRRAPDTHDAVLGHVRWHPDVADDAIARWIDRSRTQFDFPLHAGEAGFGRFYSCNVSLKRDFFLDAGGFDEAFTFDYEDLDAGWRFGERGMRLWYEPAAQVLHLHGYDLSALVRRWESRARAERQMAAKHSWFAPWFEPKARAAAATEPVSRIWPSVEKRAPWLPSPVRRRVVARADLWYLQQVAPFFLNAWDGDRGMEELKTYLGDRFDEQLLREHRERVDEEEHAAEDEETFYRTSEAYLYDLTAFAMWPTKVPYREDLRRLVAPGARLLDYGCGIGADGLVLAEAGYDVAFADFDNPSTAYLRWRLERRGLNQSVYDIEGEVPGGFDLAYSFDVIEHVDDPFGFLAILEARAAIVMVNLLEPDPDDTHLHKPLPIEGILQHAKRRGRLHYRKYYNRSHLVAYRGDAKGPANPG